MRKGSIIVVSLVILIVAFLMAPWAVPTQADETGMDQRVAELEARIEIQDLMMNYEWAVDNAWEEGAADLFGSLFAEDATYEFPEWGITIEGRDAIVYMFLNWIKPAQDDPFSHLGGVVINIDGNTATGRDSFYHVGYNASECSTNPEHPNYNPKKPTCGSRSFEDLEITMGWHQYEFAKIDGQWQITYMAGHPRHNSAEIQ